MARIILPNSKSEKAFLAALCDENIYAECASAKLELRLPKFEIQSSFEDIVDLLKQLGVSKIFNSIDCSGTLGVPSLVV